MFKIGEKVIVYFNDGISYCIITRLWPLASWAEVHDLFTGKVYPATFGSMAHCPEVAS